MDKARQFINKSRDVSSNYCGVTVVNYLQIQINQAIVTTDLKRAGPTETFHPSVSVSALFLHGACKFVTLWWPKNEIMHRSSLAARLKSHASVFTVTAHARTQNRVNAARISAPPHQIKPSKIQSTPSRHTFKRNRTFWRPRRGI